jgi:hypothetical protein
VWILLNENLLTSLSKKLFFFEAISIALIAYIMISFPFDLFGGWILPNKYERSNQSFTSFLKKYLRGIGLHATILSVIGSIYLFLFAVTPFDWQWIVILIFATLIQFLLLYFQSSIAKLLANFEITSSPRYQVWRSSDIGFTGGISFTSKDMILPNHWLESFSPKEIQHLLDRRGYILQSKSYQRGVMGAFLFNLIGTWIGVFGCHFLGITIGENGYLTYLLSWVAILTLWSFWGLLVLPSLSQKATIHADTIWKNKERNIITKTITQLDQFQDKEPKRSPGIQMIFHPITSVELRLQGLEKGENTTIGAWHIARQCIYLSWGIFSFLGRAVHCNVGRPELWVYLPSDG